MDNTIKLESRIIIMSVISIIGCLLIGYMTNDMDMIDAANLFWVIQLSFSVDLMWRIIHGN